MTVIDLILRALVRVNLLFNRPGSAGWHRACPAAATPRTPVAAVLWRAPGRPRRTVDDWGPFTPLAGEDHDLVRPYVALYEREQERRREERHRHALRMPLVAPEGVR